MRKRWEESEKLFVLWISPAVSTPNECYYNCEFVSRNRELQPIHCVIDVKWTCVVSASQMDEIAVRRLRNAFAKRQRGYHLRLRGQFLPLSESIWHVNDPLHIEANACVHRAMARRNGQADLHVFYSVLSMIMAFEWGHVGCVHLNELGKRQIIVLFVRYTRTSYLVHIWVSGYCV